MALPSRRQGFYHLYAFLARSVTASPIIARSVIRRPSILQPQDGSVVYPFASRSHAADRKSPSFRLPAYHLNTLGLLIPTQLTNLEMAQPHLQTAVCPLIQIHSHVRLRLNLSSRYRWGPGKQRLVTTPAGRRGRVLLSPSWMHHSPPRLLRCSKGVLYPRRSWRCRRLFRAAGKPKHGTPLSFSPPECALRFYAVFWFVGTFYFLFSNFCGPLETGSCVSSSPFALESFSPLATR